MNKKFELQGLIISIGIALLTGFLSSILSGNPGEVYKTLTLPPYAPPAWLFGVIWTILYLLMGVAAYLVYLTPSAPADKKNALIAYGLQLFVNFSWSIVFFRFQDYGASVIVLALLLLLVALTLMFFYNINRLAAILLIPYLIWLLVAYYLNSGIYVLNP